MACALQVVSDFTVMNPRVSFIAEYTFTESQYCFLCFPFKILQVFSLKFTENVYVSKSNPIYICVC